MKNYPAQFNNEEELEEALSRPSPELVNMMKRLPGDIIFLGVAGKMGVSMARMAQRANQKAGTSRRITGVARFSNPELQVYLEESGIHTLKGDLLDTRFVHKLPDAAHVVYLAGMKFGTAGNEPFTWAMNAFLPGLIAERYKNSRIVALSTGCVYPLVDVAGSGSAETDPPGPVGEYAQSCLGRERMFEYGSVKYNTPVTLIRLNYAVEMRYGVLVDIATRIYNEEIIDLTMGYANVIWQGDANDMILRTLGHCQSPARIINISGAERVSVRRVAEKMAYLMGKKARFSGQEAPSALLVDVSYGHKLLGSPRIPLEQIIAWTAHWVSQGRRLLGKPTHYEVRDGKY